AALAALEAIPGQATTSATSALYPHLSARHDAYWFPAGDGAAWLALDVAGNDHPLSPIAMRDAALRELGRPDAELVSAQAGVLVVRRTSAPRDGLLTDDPAERSLGSVLRTHPELLPPEFYDFVSAAAPATALGPVRFGDSLELIGYELHRWPEVGLLGDSATLVTYWRATQPLAEDLRFALAATRQPDGALAGLQEDASPAPLWWPTSRWPTGRTMRLEMAAPRLRGIQALGVAVEDSAGERLPASSSGVPLWDGGFIAAVARVA
ncbi:MAG TPA: hypothetical protein VF157_15040, partial [Chloroflexota bacterium]